MSVIGTTLKQPRVFAHDAVALKDLPGCTWRGVKGVDLIDNGSGFTVGEYSTWLSSPITTSNAGNGLKIKVDGISPTGEIVETGIDAFCGWGNAYNVGDIVTVNPPTVIHQTGIIAAGTGYPNAIPPVSTSGGNGTGMTVDYTDDGLGGVTSVTIVVEGSGYIAGDIITIDGGNNDATFSIANSQSAAFEVVDLVWTDWGYGCPFTSAYMGSQKVLIEDLTDANVGEALYGSAAYTNPLPNLGEGNVNGELGQIDQLSGFLKKTIYTINCECGEEGPSPECKCTYETPGPGAALYIGAEMTRLTLIMESGSKTTFYNVPSGSFMPVSALTVCEAIPATEGVEPKEVILALF